MQASSSAYEWSDGTRYDYKATITDLRQGSSSVDQHAGCVFITPTGSWVTADCHTLVEGAVCYNTAVTTSSQSKTLAIRKTLNDVDPPTTESFRHFSGHNSCVSALPPISVEVQLSSTCVCVVMNQGPNCRQLQ